MLNSYKWQFKARFRRESYGWKGTSLALKRLKEAVSEIKRVNKSDPVSAGEGIVSLLERLWPSLEHIDTSSGSMGSAVNRTLDALIPFLIDSPANMQIRRKWLERLYSAVCDDGVEYLSPVEDRWGEICVFSELVNEWADRIFPLLLDDWSDHQPGSHVVGTNICLSCLLVTERYDELDQILSICPYNFWHYDVYWAESLRRKGKVDDAIAFAKSRQLRDYERHAINEFCEQTLLGDGRKEEAYQQYGLFIQKGNTYIAQYRTIVKKYPEKDPKQILVDLINQRGGKGAWFASARKAGFLDIARDCALNGTVDPKTLNRAAGDLLESYPEFVADISLRAVELIVGGYGYEVTSLDLKFACNHLFEASKRIQLEDWAKKEIEKLANCKSQFYDMDTCKILMEELNKIS